MPAVETVSMSGVVVTRAILMLLFGAWLCAVLPFTNAISSRDAMVGFATEYSYDVVFRLAHAYTAATKPDQKLVLFVNMAPETIKSLCRRFPPLKLHRVADVSHKPYRRYLIMLKWIREHRADYDRIILTDTRDIAIYSDPFVQFANMDLNRSLMIFTEVVPYYYDKWYNQPAIRNCYGQVFLDSIMHEMVTGRGVVAGFTGAIVAYLEAFAEQLQIKRNCDLRADTAIHVYITHSVLLGVQVENSEVSRIRHAPAWGLDVDLHKPLNNTRGEPYAMIHQLDRFPEVWNAYIAEHAT